MRLDRAIVAARDELEVEDPDHTPVDQIDQRGNPGAGHLVARELDDQIADRSHRLPSSVIVCSCCGWNDPSPHRVGQPHPSIGWKLAAESMTERQLEADDDDSDDRRHASVRPDARAAT